MATIIVFPKKINFISDDTEVELIENITTKKGVTEKYAKYIYTMAKVFKGNEIILSLTQIQDLYSSGMIKIS